jgi:hypothetical protein
LKETKDNSEIEFPHNHLWSICLYFYLILMC